MVSAHDFVKFPELTNGQMDFYYFDSPHQQIFEDFEAKVIKVTDGDTIRVTTDFRDFDFPIRLINVAAPEPKMPGGSEAHSFLETALLGKIIDVKMNKKNRVGKWGRLLGKVFEGGTDVGEESISNGFSVPWERRSDGKIPELD